MKNVLSIQSHVVFGYAGNKSATFPMQLNGIDVWALNTVQFSNHTQYGKWTGMVIPHQQIPEIVNGIEAIGELKNCDAVISGYIGSADQVDEIIKAFHQVKTHNKNALYLCDPVMGSEEKGCVVADGVREKLIDIALPHADIITPNLFELQQLSGLEVSNFEQAINAVQHLLGKGPKMVVVKHLGSAGKYQGKFDMLLGTQNGVWLLSRPLYPFAKDPVGVGDLTAGLFLANLLNGKSELEAFERMGNAVNEVMEITHKLGSYELQLIEARHAIMDPKAQFTAEKVA
ncbi:pyridoxal kinase [Pasteurella langaaensis DSM 22999]|uniref:Pyridoxal kinase PdxY n=1 Tax=Alitibacter langaaensis DSM 22999 TaxID=1122935 RepID=A0A2U0SNW4_9PAST|nr:pyridoxal kinase PdxY [Pasteurella langaaensis]PVX33017.1 pyridoxal kinase [Pasteurella langaaensis DSM 22999]